VAGEEPAPGPSPGAHHRRGDAYIISGGDATMAKERSTVHLMLGDSGEGIVSHHDRCGLSCEGSSRRRREGRSNKREGRRHHHGSPLIDVDPFGEGIGTGETCRIGKEYIILLPFVQS
jgi:hypothetical protein